MAIEMSNEQIIEEFDSLFATDDGSEGNEPEVQDEPEVNDDDEPEGNEEPDGEGSEGEGEGSEGTEGNDDKGSTADKKRRQQNYAFAEMRNKLKAKDTFIEDLAASIGLDSNLSTYDKQAKIK